MNTKLHRLAVMMLRVWLVVMIGMSPAVANAGDPVSLKAYVNSSTSAGISAAGGALKADQTRTRIISNFGGLSITSPTKSNGTTQLSASDRMAFYPNTDATDLRLIVANGYVDVNGVLNGPGNALKWHWVIEQNAKLFEIPIGSATGAKVSNVSGAKSASIVGDGQIVTSEPVAVRVASGAQTYIRNYKVVASGESWPYTMSAGAYSFSANYTTDVVYGNTVTDQSDQTNAFTQSFGAQVTNGWALFGPMAIIGTQLTPKPVVLITGNSIAYGQGDQSQRGYIVRALEATGIGYHNDGIPAARLIDINANHTALQALAPYVDHVVVHDLTNDLYNAALGTTPSAVITNAKTVYLNFAKAFGRPNNKLWFATTIPRVATSDSMASYAGQTPSATYESLRIVLNNFIRDPSSNGLVAYLRAQLVGTRINIGGVFDPALAMERNSDGSPITLDASQQQAASTGGYWPIPNATLASSITAATSATLATAWTWASGNYSIKFSDGTTKTATFTNGSAAITWTGAVTASTVTTMPNFPSTDGIHPATPVAIVMSTSVPTASLAAY